MVLRRAVWTAILLAAITSPTWAAEPSDYPSPAELAKKEAAAAPNGKKDPAPDEIPTHLIKVLRLGELILRYGLHAITTPLAA